MARKFLEPGLEFHRTCQLGRCAPMNSLWTIDYRLPHSGQILGSHINDKLDRLASHQARTVHICQTWQFVICLILINSILHIRSFPTFLTSGQDWPGAVHFRTSYRMVSPTTLEQKAWSLWLRLLGLGFPSALKVPYPFDLPISWILLRTCGLAPWPWSVIGFLFWLPPLGMQSQLQVCMST